MTIKESIDKFNGIEDHGINWTWIYFEKIEEAEGFEKFCEDNLNSADWRGIIIPWRVDQKWNFACKIHH